MSTDTSRQAAMERKSAALLAPFEALGPLLQAHATLTAGVKQAATTASNTAIGYFDAGAGDGTQPAEPPDQQIWDKFLEDLDNSFAKLEEGGMNPHLCQRRWMEAMHPLAQDWFEVRDAEQAGKVSHENANAQRQQLVDRMKVTGQTYMKCLSQPPRLIQSPQGPAGITDGR